MKKKCVITGIGLVSCFGSDKRIFYQSMLDGKSAVFPIDFEVSGIENLFGAGVTGFDPLNYMDRKNARRLDPAILYALGAAKEAALDAKISLDSIAKERVGVLIGTGNGGMNAAHKNLTIAALKDFSRVSPFFIPHLITNMPGAIVGIEFGVTGPNYSISTACATANYSLLAAKRHIECGDADMMITGGVESAMNPAAFGGFTALRALSRSYQNPQLASRPFDKGRNGFVMGEGAAVFILESEEHAKKRGAHIYGELSGGAITSDAHHMTNPKEDGSEVARCMELAMKDAGLERQEVDFISAHATSTPPGDLCEMRAISTVFGGNKKLPKITSCKSMIGHPLGAAGGLELASILMAMESGKLHPTINVDDPIDEVGEFDLVREGSIDYNIDHALSNSFGFGGHNSVIAVSRYE